MRFTKMQGLGNDYLYVFGEVPANIAEISRVLSDRHFGVGADGMIYIAPCESADFSMRIFNADGSEAKMCGNGIRCVAKYVYDKGYTDKTVLNIQTLSGIKTVKLEVAFGEVQRVSVDMGIAEVAPCERLCVAGRQIEVHPANIGNPHAVVICQDAEAAPIATIGKAMQTHPHFPDGVNVEWISLLGENRLRMRVWERGSGITMACGTGACAATTVAVCNGLCTRGTPIEVVLDGGSLSILADENNRVQMSGPAAFVFEGESEDF